MEPNRIIVEVDDKNLTDRPIDDRVDRSQVKIDTDPNRRKFEAKSPDSLWGSRLSVSATQEFIQRVHHSMLGVIPLEDDRTAQRALNLTRFKERSPSNSMAGDRTLTENSAF